MGNPAVMPVGLERAREGFIATGVLPAEVPVAVGSAWERCRRVGVDPDDGRCTQILAESELAPHLAANSRLLNAARTFFHGLQEVLSSSGFVVAIAAEDGLVLETFGSDDRCGLLAAHLNLIPGALWREEVTGNTALSMASVAQEPVQITGPEHYCRRYHAWCSCAVPLFYTDAQVLGVLALFSAAADAHPHTLGMVTAAARAIEGQLAAAHTEEKLKLQHKYQEAIVESMFDGFLIIDDKGCVIHMNASGGRILGVDHKEVVGEYIADIVDFKPVILDVLETGKGYVDKEFMVKTGNGFKHFLKTAVPIRDERGQITAVVDTFREIKRVRKLVNRMVGARARFTFADIIGESRTMQECMRLAKIAAQSSSRVLLQGESGTGKELFAQAIHNASSRCHGPFVALNCAALPHELIESELFGYEDGAFTGAFRGGRPGKFELASGGTIFFDEIGDMPLDMQAKLLRVLEENRVVRLGGRHYINCDVRLIAATNKDLAREVKSGNFRRDLYYRLNVIYIPLPPLRERGADIELFVDHFARQISRQLALKSYSFSPEALQVLRAYSWPGNARELKNIIERVLNTVPGPVIKAAEVRSILGSQSAPGCTGGLLSIEELERQAIKKALKIAEGNISRAARLLKISRNTLYNKLKKYRIEAS